MKITVFIIIAIISLFGTANASKAITDKDVKQALNELDIELSRRRSYVSARQAKIDSISTIVNSLPAKSPDMLPLLMELGDAYHGYLSDSAKVAYERGEQVAKLNNARDFEIRFLLKKLVNMTLTGFGPEAAQTFQSILTENLPDTLKVDIFSAGRQLYDYQASFYSSLSESSKEWNAKSIDMLRRLLEILPDNSEEHILRESEFLWVTGHSSEAKTMLDEYLQKPSLTPTLEAIAANIMAQIHKSHDNINGQLYYLAKSATADIQNATRETVSLHELGAAMFENGDLERAHQYLNAALSDAVECNASMRMLQASGALPVIAEAHRAQEARTRLWTSIVIVIMGILLFGLMMTSMKLRSEMKRMKLLQEGLASANRMKEMYISQFLNLCTTYMEKLHQFCKIAERKISTGNADELYKLITSGSFAEEQSEEFYDTFDRAFLHIYPDFVDDVNQLLRPDEKIELAEGELLNTDLRILAFMRLGVEDSTRIAQVLNYSVHTIYAYRNRLRNRALNRDSLENDVMKIGELRI
ncbi:MAG: DUF6377 domain-containing protein [Bacteroides sp.]|nr:DUF6377 domain-containing protein [Bacteroides sp.]MCM1389293.1 DUF6377 domain-containing protein [Bacteroides sp.]